MRSRIGGKPGGDRPRLAPPATADAAFDGGLRVWLDVDVQSVHDLVRAPVSPAGSCIE
jgi:hypothetical protein